MRFLSTRISPVFKEEHTCQLRNRRRTALGPGRLHRARHLIFSDVIASFLQSTSVAVAATPQANLSTLPCAHYPSASSQQSPSIAAMPSKPNSQRDSESKVRSWGFPHVFTWTDGPYVMLTAFLPFLLACPQAKAKYARTDDQSSETRTTPRIRIVV